MARTARNKPEQQLEGGDGTEALKDVSSYYENNKKRINSIVIAIVLVVGGFLGYKYMYQQPREEKAANAMALPQQYFAADSTNLALNGDGQNAGFLSIMRKYSGTKSANLCHYYVGICYLKQGDFANAIKHLKDFDGKGTPVAYAAWGALGDAYMENKDIKNGIKYYEKASSNKNDDVYAPMYLYRLAVAYELDNNIEKAKEAYLRIQEDYPTSTPAQSVDRDIARVGALK